MLALHYGKKVPVKKVVINIKNIFLQGNEMVKMGIMISLSGLIESFSSYIMRVVINHQGGLGEVGLYHAGFAIISSYVGLVFSAMGTDYYPRLSAVANNNDKATELINQQSEVAILILGPILSIFLVFIKLVVILIYSTKFIPVEGMIHCAVLGMYFKAVSWSIAFILLAKGASKLFFWNELMASSYELCFNIIGYRLAGLDGLGISFLVGFFVYSLQVFILAKNKYGFSFTKDFYQIFCFQLLIGVLCFILVKVSVGYTSYVLGMPLILSSCLYSLWKINKKIDIMSFINEFKNKFKVK